MKPSLAPRDRMIEAAITLMRRSGYSGVGINEVLAESGAPKGSLYHYFPQGKRQVATEALEVNSARTTDFIDEKLAVEGTPAEKIRRLFAAFAARLEKFDYRQSCAAGCVSLDLGEELDGEVHNAVQHAFERYVDVIARHLAFADRRRASSFARLVLTVIEGGYVRGRAERSAAAFREAGEWLARLAELEAGSARKAPRRKKLPQ